MNLPTFSVILYPKDSKIRIGTKKIWYDMSPCYFKKNIDSYDVDFTPTNELLQIAYEFFTEQLSDRDEIAFPSLENLPERKMLLSILIDKIVDDGVMTEEETLSFRELCYEKAT